MGKHVVSQSYMLLTVWLTLHTIAVHYTYPKVPLGISLAEWFNFHGNHFDRIVHFSFGFFLTLPLVEVFRRRCNAKGWLLLPYLVVMRYWASAPSGKSSK